jgi:hypothetical protein
MSKFVRQSNKLGAPRSVSELTITVATGRVWSAPPLMKSGGADPQTKWLEENSEDAVT